MNYQNQAEITTSFAISALEYPIVLAMLFLACWADPKPRDIALEGDSAWSRNFLILSIKSLLFSSDQLDDLTPEKYSSALSKVVFGWMEPLIYRGWNKQLTKDDLWSLINENRFRKNNDNFKSIFK